MIIVNGKRVYRWQAGANFIAAWDADRANEHVPNDMLELPGWVNVSQLDIDAVRLLAPLLDGGAR